MKFIVTVLALFFSASTFATTEVKGNFNKKNNQLSITLIDSGFMFPYDAGNLYLEMKGFDTSAKSFKRSGVEMECTGKRVSGKGIFGNCLVVLDGVFVKTNKGYFIFKIQGQSAYEVFREFHNQKSLTFNNSGAYLTMIPGRNEFYFGIKTSLVKVEY